MQHCCSMAVLSGQTFKIGGAMQHCCSMAVLGQTKTGSVMQHCCSMAGAHKHARFCTPSSSPLLALPAWLESGRPCS